MMDSSSSVQMQIKLEIDGRTEPEAKVLSEQRVVITKLIETPKTYKVEI